MNVTVGDLLNMPALKGMKLVAGGTGLGNTVTKAGLLDYEFDVGHREKYFHRHFVQGQFVLTSFLYAKNNEDSIMDAVRRLHLKGCSGLAVKNIYKLNIRDSVLRFADAKGFPVFLLLDKGLYFEDMIFAVAERVRQAASVHHGAEVVDRILHSGLDEESVETLARTLNPSFCDDAMAVCFRFGREFSENDFLELAADGSLAPLLAPADTLLYYRNGAILIHSFDGSLAGDHSAATRRRAEAVLSLAKAPARAGVSAAHHGLGALRATLEECIRASLVPADDGDGVRMYDDLGVFKAYFAAAREPAAIAFSDGIVKAIQAHDAENNGSLAPTARWYVLSGGEMAATARALDVHVNTVRYRLESIGTLVGINILGKAGFEEFSAAVKIGICREALEELY